MCGFTSYYSFEKKISNEIILKLKASSKDMLYRGPDNQSFWNDDRVAISHVRLSILGLLNGNQPIFNEDGTLMLVCNGEIYNYLNLKTNLESKGHHFSTLSDCEVILHLYEDYGDQLNIYLDGMFSYFLYDKKNNKILVSRDRAGKKPLYYSLLKDGIVFSSELKVIKKHFLDYKSINFDVLRQVQENTFSISIDETYISQIKKLPYGNFASIEKGNLLINRYHKRIIYPSNTQSYDVVCKNVKELFFNAVEKRLQSEVPISIMLSAGIDSSAIACVSKKLGKTVNVISVGYKGDWGVDERFEAKKLSDEKGFNWNEIELNIEDYCSSTNEIFSILDEPNGDISMYAQYSIYKRTKDLGYKVLLSGIGGDELFYGYKTHNDLAIAIQSFEEFKRYLPLKNIKETLNFILFFLRKLKTFQKVNIKKVNSALSELIINVEHDKLMIDRFDWHKVNYQYYIDKIYFFLNYAWLTNNCYLLADKLAMANSIEVRCPFADIDLINYVDTLDISFKFRNNKPKQLFIDSMKGIVPDYVLNRSKSGFTPPMQFINNVVQNYENRFFNEKLFNFSQIVTDYFASE